MKQKTYFIYKKVYYVLIYYIFYYNTKHFALTIKKPKSEEITQSFLQKNSRV